MPEESEVLKNARIHLASFKLENPQFADDAQDFYYLMVDEIDAGESPQNEAELFYNALSDLLTDDD